MILVLKQIMVFTEKKKKNYNFYGINVKSLYGKLIFLKRKHEKHQSKTLNQSGLIWIVIKPLWVDSKIYKVSICMKIAYPG